MSGLGQANPARPPCLCVTEHPGRVHLRLPGGARSHTQPRRSPPHGAVCCVSLATMGIDELAAAIRLACPAHQQGLQTRLELRRSLGARTFERAVRVGALQRVRRGVYAPAPLLPRGRFLVEDDRPDPAYVAEVRATLLSLGPDVAASRRTAAVLRGFALVTEPTEVEIDVHPDRGRLTMKGVDFRRTPSSVELLVVLPGTAPLWVTTALATVLGVAADRPFLDAVACADGALRTKAVSMQELTSAVRAQRGRPGVRQLRRVVRAVDPVCGSVLESRVRLLLIGAGLDGFTTQRQMYDEHGRLLARVDFCWEEQRVALEADGRRFHDKDTIVSLDRQKNNELQRVGWRIIRVTWDDVVNRPEQVVQMVRDFLMGIAA